MVCFNSFKSLQKFLFINHHLSNYGKQLWQCASNAGARDPLTLRLTTNLTLTH